MVESGAEEVEQKTAGYCWGSGSGRLRAAIFREPLVTTSTATRRPRAARLKRRAWRLARWMRRHLVAVVACTLLAIPGAFLWSEKVLNNFEIQEPIKHDVRLAARAKMDIKDLLTVIGHGVTISSVEAREFNREFAAAYYRKERRVFVESSSEFADDTLLFVMGHECAHAMLIQGGFLERNPATETYQYVLHEVAADVLGAHLAGRVVANRGGDGEALTKNLIWETRAMSKSNVIGRSALKDRNPEEWDGKFRTFVGNGYWLDPNRGAEKLIDTTDRICREHYDLWEAARVIAKELHNVNEKKARNLTPPVDWRPRR